MINKIYIWTLSLLINFLDKGNKKKVINFFKLKLDKQKIRIIDIGAHKGETIDLFIENFNVKKIYAFEPNPKVFDFLKKKIKRKNIKRIILFNIGLGKKKEKKKLLVFNESSSSTFHAIDKNTNYYKRKKFFLSPFSKVLVSSKFLVDIYPLSEIFKKNKISKIHILKIDTEGYEFNILKGLTKQLLKKINFIYFEHHYDLMIKKNYNFYDINSFLLKNNFKLKFKLKMKLRKTFEYIYENRNK